jgi:DNA-binding transcriptional LysR family regulator
MTQYHLSMTLDTRLFTGLPVLAAVLESGSFVRAGEALGLTQSGVSRAVQRLEAQLGIRLFERTSKAVRLTEDGKRFCDEALPLLHRMEEVAANISGVSGEVQGQLRINVDATVARLFLAPRIHGFLEAYPDLRLELAIRDEIGDLVAEGFDAAIRFGDPKPSALIARRLLQVRILTCASPAYFTRHERPRTPRDLERQPHECIHFRNPVTGRPFPWEFHQGKKRLTVAVTGRLVLNDALTHLEVCRSGFGIAQIMNLGIEPILEGGALVNLFPEWSDELFPLYVYHPSRHFVPARLKVFTEFLAASLKLERSATRKSEPGK